MALYDKWLSKKGDDVTWEHLTDRSGVRSPSLTLSMEFGDSMMGLYVAIDLNGLDSASFVDWKDYMTRFQTFLLRDDNGNVITGYSREDAVFPDSGYTIVPVYLSGSTISNPLDLLDYYQYYKSKIPDFDINEDYIQNVRWFDNPDGPAQFNFYSQVTDDGLSLYAGYGVIITFEPKVEGDLIGDEKPWVSPSTMFLEDMSREVTFNSLKDSLRVTEGYAIEAFLNDEGKNIGGTSMLILNDITVTVVLVAETYELSVTVVDESGKEITDGIELEYKSSRHFGEDVSVTISYTGGQQYRILHAEGKYGSFTLSEFTFTQADDNTYSVCGFSMPSGNLDLKITLAEGYTLTVRLPVSSPSTDDNGMFGLNQDSGISVSETGESSVELDIGLNGSREIVLSLPSQYNDHSVTVTIGSCEGASAEISDGKLELTGITGDVVVDLKVNVEWILTVNGGGYDVIRDNDSLGTGSTVHTGDVLILRTHAGYEFDSRPTVSGGHITSNSPYTIAVDGTGDVTISGNATLHQIVLTVYVVFGGDQITVLPSGSLTADGTDVVLTLQGNTATGTVTVDSGGEVFLNLSFEGYIDLTETVDPSAREVTLHAVPELRDETDPVEGPTGDFVLVVSAGDADGEHTVTGLPGSGTFSIRDGMSVTLRDGKVILSGFSHAVGAVVVEIGGTATLTVVVVPQPVGLGGPVIL